MHNLPHITLIGISTRTSNTQEMDPSRAKISSMIQKFYADLSQKIQNKKDHSKLYSIYTNYESDHRGEYTYFVGQEVTSLEGNEAYEALTVPSQNYEVFSSTGVFPNVIVDLWQKIWGLPEAMAFG
ncbi:MAG TPA: effector binding domain-containing protein [Alphaproteobacteria bacterium]|nr:effector binding domain-containing protein [Alphaproteobacteria bacterium]